MIKLVSNRLQLVSKPTKITELQFLRNSHYSNIDSIEYSIGQAPEQDENFTRPQKQRFYTDVLYMNIFVIIVLVWIAISICGRGNISVSHQYKKNLCSSLFFLYYPSDWCEPFDE